jgi:hypothetical protein
MSKARSHSRSIIAALLDAAGDVGGWLEHLFVWSLELARRCFLRLDPRLYSESLRIREVIDGLAKHDSEKVAVVVLYFRTAVPTFTMNLIAALNRQSFNVAIVSNTTLDDVSRSRLLRQCCLYIERENLGRDFGGYRDGISVVLRRFANIKKLILANDSVYYLEEGLDSLVSELDGPGDFIGISEIFEHHYHVASFLLAFGPSVIADPVFRKFWSGYRPISTRMWAILEGEGALTRSLMEAGYRPHVLFKAEHLMPKLQKLGDGELKQAAGLLSAPMRQSLSEAIDHLGGCNGTARDAFVQSLIDAVIERNQMHAAGFLFMRLLNLPLFKRDVVFRGMFSTDEALEILSDLEEPVRGEIIADLAARSPPAALLRRMQYRHGFV